MYFRGQSPRKDVNNPRMVQPIPSHGTAGLYHNWSGVRLLLCERAGLLLSNLVVPYETTRITGAAAVYMGFVPHGSFFQLPTQYDTINYKHACVYMRMYNRTGSLD